MTRLHRTGPLLVLGFSTGVVQAVLLREAMAALSGSELAWGAVLAVWLAGMAAGSRLGVRVGTAGLARLAPVLVIGFGAAGVVLFRAAPALVTAGPGEPVTTWGALWVWLAAVFPAAVAGGSAFPLLANELGERDAAGAAYAAEALGALAGGVAFTFALAPWGAAAAICVAAGLAVAGSQPRLGLAGRAAVVVLGVLAAAPAGELLARATWSWSGRPGRLAAWAETRHQRLELSTGRPLALYADGRLLASFPDPWVTVPRTHLLMLLHPAPARVLATGILADGAVVPALRHSVVRLDVTEEDPTLPALLAGWYGDELAGTLDDPRLVIHGSDPIRTLRSGGTWDLIALLDGDPATLRQNRTRTVELFTLCRRHLAPDGVLVVRTGVPDTYLGGAGGRLLAVLGSSLRRVFPKLAAVPGEEVLLVAGRADSDLDFAPAVLSERWAARQLRDPVFDAELIPVLLDPGRAAPLEAFVRSARARPNTATHPRAVLLAAALTEGRGQPPLVRAAESLDRHPPLPLAAAVALLAVLLFIRGASGARLGMEAAAVVGLTSMGWWLLLLALWQASVGSVYAQVGALSATFMGGLAGGAAAARRHRSPARLLPALLGLGALLSICVASPIPLLAPRVVIPLLLLAGGLLTGAAFPGAAALAGAGDTRRGSGRGFAADEAGAAAAAVSLGLIAIPWAGTALTAAGLAVVDLAAVAAFLVAAQVRRRRTTRLRSSAAGSSPANRSSSARTRS